MESTFREASGQAPSRHFISLISQSGGSREWDGFGLQTGPVLLRVIRPGSGMLYFDAHDGVEWRIATVCHVWTGADFTAFRL
jgi:hypothetical protein